MGEENPVKFQAQPEGQPEAIQTADSQAQGNEQAKSGLSEDRIAQIIDERLDRFNRQQQSLRDKQESRIKNEIQKQIGLMQKAGVEVTDEMKQRIETVAREDFANEFQQSNDSSGTEGQPKPRMDQREMNPKEQLVNSEVDKLDQQYGFSINQDDPEAKDIQTDNPFEFVRKYEKALIAKAERLSVPGQTNPAAQLHMAGGSGTPGNRLANVTDKDALWAEVKRTVNRR